MGVFFHHLAYVVGYTVLYMLKITIALAIMAFFGGGVYLAVYSSLKYFLKYSLDIDEKPHNILIIAVLIFIGLFIGANVVKMLGLVG